MSGPFPGHHQATAMTETIDDLKFLMTLAVVIFGGFGLDALLR